MNRDSVVFAISGVMFGLLVGWILGTQMAPPPAVASAGAPAAQMQPPQTPPPLDVQRAADLERQANAEPANAAVRVDLGNLYFDAERYDLATSWYEAALKINPKDVNASTDLGVSYYSSNQVDRALEQLEHSLAIDPTHTKTLLNKGIVLAFGKQDLEAARRTWELLVKIAPKSPEAERAAVAIEALKGAHPAAVSPPPGGRAPGGKVQ
jgi:tetratricopeptide (TPR) repeat protein